MDSATHTIWVVGSDPAKVQEARDALSAEGYVIETMDAATAKRRLGAAKEALLAANSYIWTIGQLRASDAPDGLIQFAICESEGWLRPEDHLAESYRDWPWSDRFFWIVVSPRWPDIERDRLFGTDPPWTVSLEPLDIDYLRRFVRLAMEAWGRIGNLLLELREPPVSETAEERGL